MKNTNTTFKNNTFWCIFFFQKRSYKACRRIIQPKTNRFRNSSDAETFTRLENVQRRKCFRGYRNKYKILRNNKKISFWFEHETIMRTMIWELIQRRGGNMLSRRHWMLQLGFAWDVVVRYLWDVAQTSLCDIAETYHWDVLATFHRDVVGCFIWNVPAT